MEFGEAVLLGSDLIRQTTEIVKIIKQRLETVQSRQKSYADRRRRPLEFEEGSYVFLKVSMWKDIIRFGKKGKLAPKFVGPFRILQWIGMVSYRLGLLPNMSNVHPVFHVSMLRAYEPDRSHVIDYSELVVEEDVSYAVTSIEIIDCQEKILRRKTIPLVRVLWRHNGVEEKTWEREADMRESHHELYSDTN